VPFVATARRSLPDAAGEYPPEFEAPLPDRLVRYRDAAGGQHLLDHAQAQREPKIQSYRVADDLSGVAMAGVNRVSRRPHPARLPDHPAPTKPALGQLDGAFRSVIRDDGRLPVAAGVTILIAFFAASFDES
jgi:hypothetical protein